ncbi:MAG: hypothetical protein EON58_13460 [Alphaproteobacteria bacterium]|nr:MAG: hypothetical protein EON58_13460 [Alphaproteobacteria bacterium]
MAMTATYTSVNGQILHENRNGSETELVPDPLGSVIQTRSSSGSTTSSTVYWPYGETRTASGANPTPWGYVGTYGYHQDSGEMLYVRARDYRPSLERWQTVDPLWPQEPAYRYVAGMPTMAIDPSGASPVCLIPCAPCAACLIDLLIVCPPGAGWEECVQGVWNELPAWLKWGCGLACAGCLACVVRALLPPPVRPQPEPLPQPPGKPQLPPTSPRPLPPGNQEPPVGPRPLPERPCPPQTGPPVRPPWRPVLPPKLRSPAYVLCMFFCNWLCNPGQPYDCGPTFCNDLCDPLL